MKSEVYWVISIVIIAFFLLTNIVGISNLFDLVMVCLTGVSLALFIIKNKIGLYILLILNLFFLISLIGNLLFVGYAEIYKSALALGLSSSFILFWLALFWVKAVVVLIMIYLSKSTFKIKNILPNQISISKGRLFFNGLNLPSKIKIRKK